MQCNRLKDLGGASYLTPFTRCNRLLNRLNNRLDKRLHRVNGVLISLMLLSAGVRPAATANLLDLSDSSVKDHFSSVPVSLIHQNAGIPRRASVV